MGFHVPNKYRDRKHPQLKTTEADGKNGVFHLPGSFKEERPPLMAIASNAGGWEHVSVTVNQQRCPTWEEMCYIKSVFWDPEDCVVQYHPSQSEYVNLHQTCLHLWRPIGILIPEPPSKFEDLDWIVERLFKKGGGL